MSVVLRQPQMSRNTPDLRLLNSGNVLNMEESFDVIMTRIPRSFSQQYPTSSELTKTICSSFRNGVHSNKKKARFCEFEKLRDSGGRCQMQSISRRGCEEEGFVRI